MISANKTESQKIPHRGKGRQEKQEEMNPPPSSLREKFIFKSPELLEERIPGTTILGNIRIRVRCHLCHSEEVRSSPVYWKSLMGLTGECFKCEGHTEIETVFFDSERKEIVVIPPNIYSDGLLEKLSKLAGHNPNNNSNNRQNDSFNSLVPRDILSGDLSTLHRLIKVENINTVMDRGMTPLFFASYHGKAEVVDVLLKAKADINANSKDGMKPIHGAASSKNPNVVKILINAKANVNDTDLNGFSSMHNACIEGQLEICRILLEQDGINVNAATMTRATPLHLAARSGTPGLVTLLLNMKAQIDPMDIFGRTPLANAIYFGKETSGKELLGAGASLLGVKPDLPIPAWAGGESARTISQKDLQIENLRREINILKSDGAERYNKLEDKYEKLKDKHEELLINHEELSKKHANLEKALSLFGMKTFDEPLLNITLKNPEQIPKEESQQKK